MQNAQIQMFEVDQSLELLNRILAEKGVSASDVVSIVEQPAAAMAIGEHSKAKYRVYYRG
ncbi:MAG: hypothetical protein ACR2PO_08820 [Methyloligellaceae bacterium]